MEGAENQAQAVVHKGGIEFFGPRRSRQEGVDLGPVSCPLKDGRTDRIELEWQNAVQIGKGQLGHATPEGLRCGAVFEGAEESIEGGSRRDVQVRRDQTRPAIELVDKLLQEIVGHGPRIHIAQQHDIVTLVQGLCQPRPHGVRAIGLATGRRKLGIMAQVRAGPQAHDINDAVQPFFQQLHIVERAMGRYHQQAQRTFLQGLCPDRARRLLRQGIHGPVNYAT